MDKLSKHAIRMLEIVDNERGFYKDMDGEVADIARAVYDLILQVQMLKMTDRKTEPQTCANGCKWLTQYGECTEPSGECHIEYRTEVDEPQTDCETCRYAGECDWKQWQKCYCEQQSVRSNLEPFRVDEPQTERSE